jgi:hypothetical protein
MDSNPRSPVYGELAAPGRAQHDPRRHRESPERRSVASTSSLSDLWHAWGAFHMDNADLELGIGFGCFEHLAALFFAGSVRDDRICQQERMPNSGIP